MSDPITRTEEERGRTRNNENGYHYPTPQQDIIHKVTTHWTPMGRFDVTDLSDETDGHGYPIFPLE